MYGSYSMMDLFDFSLRFSFMVGIYYVFHRRKYISFIKNRCDTTAHHVSRSS